MDKDRLAPVTFPLLLERLFRARELSFTAGRIENVLNEHGNTDEFLLYRLRLRSLASESNDGLIVFPTNPRPESFVGFGSILERLGSCGRLACVAPDPTSISAIAPPPNATLWSPEQLFDRIFSLPRDFLAQLRDAAEIERVDKFATMYQERDAFVHNAPSTQTAGTKVALDDYLCAWLADHRRASPILLLGERGSGKTWQMLHFAQQAYLRHRESPWHSGPAIVIKLRELVNIIEESSAAAPVLSDYVFQKYRGITTLFEAESVFGALLGLGHTVLCVDGLDEMDLVPTDSVVRARFTTLLLLLSKRTRFILTCRPGHFASISNLLDTSVWSGARVADAFEVLEILPFDDRRKLRFVDLAAATNANSTTLKKVLGDQTESSQPLARALSICARYPALLAYITELMDAGVTDTATLIGRAIRGAMIEFNLVRARTREDYQTGSGEWIDLSLDRREELLGDLAWYLATRGLDSIDLDHLPPRLRLTYRISDDALRRDLRSQTALEVADTAQPSRKTDSTKGRSSAVFGLDDMSESTSHVRFTLQNETESANSTDSSVAGAYFLARYIADRLTERGPFGALDLGIRLKPLGKVPLGSMCSAILRDMMLARGFDLRSLGRDGWRLLTRAAHERQGELFSPWFRHLSENLARLGCLSANEAASIDPWNASVSSIVRPPLRLPSYEMVLVPTPPGDEENIAFLMGAHEVTNEQYLQFIESSPTAADLDSTVQGPEWSVQRMTLAGTPTAKDRSRNFVLSNEYHLFFWLQYLRQRPPSPNLNYDDTDSLRFRPAVETFRHPVSYVSWYATAAYCDWLSLGDTKPRVYQDELRRALGDTSQTMQRGQDEGTGYRLPRINEWYWAARGGHLDVRWPWELFPYYLDPEDLRKPVMDAPCFARFRESQSVMHDIMRDTGKHTYDVLYDDPNELGICGLIGNVREWCDDPGPPESTSNSKAHSQPPQRYVLGATGYLGKPTFDFKREDAPYRVPLYPRNTNPDVGFRLARSLTNAERCALAARADAIKTVSEELT